MTAMLTAKDMQDLLQVDRSTIYRMVEAGRLPAIKVGKQWRFPGDQVDRWLQSQIGAPVPPAQTAPSQAAESDLGELLPLACVQLIQDTFAETIGVMLVITDLAGQPITDISNPCGLFKAINQTPSALQKCIESWHNLAVTIDLEPKFRPSHLGLLCARGLIRVGSELKGMVVAGGIAPEDWPPAPAALKTIAREFDVQPEILVGHLTQVFHPGEAEKVKILSVLQRIANIVAHIINERHVLMGKLDAIARLTR
jgi:PTS system nitrogen regulatory IIA component